MLRRDAWMVVAASVLWMAGCGGTADAGTDSTEEDTAMDVQLGPRDGHDLPPTDLDRVKVGDLAPDFSARSLSGDAVTLSDFRGKKNVILVFYRGYW